LKLTARKFEQLVDDLLQKTVGPTKQALADAGVDPSKIDEVVLVGGSTRIRACRRSSRSCSARSRTRASTRRSRGGRRGDSGGVLAGEVKDLLLLDVTRSRSASRRSAA
jgi:molecular chaperone DnaK